MASTEDEHLAYSRLDMTDTITSSNRYTVQLHEGVGGRDFLKICVQNSQNCGSVCTFFYIAI